MSQSFLIFTIVILPILCACLGFTAHFVIRPMVDALLDAIHELSRIGDGKGSPEALARLEAEVAKLRAEVHELKKPDDLPALGAGAKGGAEFGAGIE